MNGISIITSSFIFVLFTIIGDKKKLFSYVC